MFSEEKQKRYLERNSGSLWGISTVPWGGEKKLYSGEEGINIILCPGELKTVFVCG